MDVIRLEFPRNLLDGVRIPPESAEGRLRMELAIQLYREGLTSAGVACRLAEVERDQFWAHLAARGIPRHYGSDELAEDVEFSRG